jgi:hypothetical protein
VDRIIDQACPFNRDIPIDFQLVSDLLANALKIDEARGLSLKSMKVCAEGDSEMFVISGRNYQPLSMIESWSCGSAGCSIQFLLSGIYATPNPKELADKCT